MAAYMLMTFIEHILYRPFMDSIWEHCTHASIQWASWPYTDSPTSNTPQTQVMSTIT